MLPDPRTEPATRDLLTPLLPPGVPSEALLSAETLEALQSHCRNLEGLGFELEVRENNLRVRQRHRGFDMVIQFSDQDDLGERRRFFAALKRTFGSFWDRFSWLVHPSKAVTVPYEHVKAVLGVCQAARLRLRRVK
jgi:hypothetical protein